MWLTYFSSIYFILFNFVSEQVKVTAAKILVILSCKFISRIVFELHSGVEWIHVYTLDYFIDRLW